MAVLRGGDLNGPATHASGGAYPSTTSSKLGFKRRARPRGPTGPRRPSGALGQRGPLGPAPRRFGPLAAHGEQAGLRGRPLSVASCNQGSWRGATAARAHDHNAHTLDFGSGEPPACGPCPPRTSFIHSGSAGVSHKGQNSTVRGTNQEDRG